MEIEKNIILQENRSPGRPPKYPFASMAIGDSILVDGPSSATSVCKPYNAATQWGRRNGVKFSARVQPDNKVRIWRIQ